MADDSLCGNCGQLNLPSLSRYGGLPLAKPKIAACSDTNRVAYNRPSSDSLSAKESKLAPLPLGTLSEVALRRHCPFCRLVCYAVLSDFWPLITSEFHLRSNGKAIDVFLDTIPAHILEGKELACGPNAGPSAWYIKILSLKSGDHFVHPSHQFDPRRFGYWHS
jgi:hypothetical protein